MGIPQAAALPLPKTKQQSSPDVRPAVSFSPYLPAFLVAVVQDCLDILFVMLAAVLLPVAVVLQVLFGIGLGFLSAALLFVFTHSNASPMKRWLTFLFSQSSNALIPGVNLLPLASLSIYLVYRLDKKFAKASEGEFIA